MFEAFNNYADFSGRASRSEFWLFQLLSIFVLVVSTALIVIREGGAFVAGVGMLVLWVLIAFVPNLAVTVRRFHDHNISGWWVAVLYGVGLIPYVGLLANLGMLWVLVRAGTWGPNNYGPDPVNPWRSGASFA
jgi:uncharacterized membrane protein YhaH (DUF805 family)